MHSSHWSASSASAAAAHEAYGLAPDDCCASSVGPTAETDADCQTELVPLAHGRREKAGETETVVVRHVWLERLKVLSLTVSMLVLLVCAAVLLRAAISPNPLSSTALNDNSGDGAAVGFSTRATRSAASPPSVLRESPMGYWTSEEAAVGTRFISFDAANPLEPLIDYLIGAQCGGDPHVNTSDLSAVSFLRNQHLLFFSDSVDRFMLRFLCGGLSIRCHLNDETCPDSCPYIKDRLQGRYVHYVYPEMLSTYPDEAGNGLSVCTVGSLNLTLTHAFNWGWLPGRYINWWSQRFNYYSFSDTFSIADMMRDWLRPFFSHDPRTSANDTDVVGVLPMPTMVMAQSALWDVMYLQRLNPRNITMPVLRSEWQDIVRNVLMPAVETLFPGAVYFFRTAPPPHDYDKIMLAEVSNIVRQAARDTRTTQLTAASAEWHVWDIASMLVEREDWCFDAHHLGPTVLYQALNVLFNQLKAIWSERQSGNTAALN